MARLCLLCRARHKRHYAEELLRRGFPRVRFPGDPQLFAAVAGLGGELIGLHLLQDARLQETTPRLVGGAGLPVAQGRRYSEADRTLYLAEDGLTLVDIGPEVWEYRIGGYRVLGQWLRARAGRVLSDEERCELPRIAEALRLTRDVQTRIGEVLCI